MNGFADAEPKRLALSRIAVATDNPTACLADILAFSQNIRLSCRPVLTAYALNHALASLAASLADVHLCPLLGRYCCKSRKSNDAENLAKADV